MNFTRFAPTAALRVIARTFAVMVAAVLLVSACSSTSLDPEATRLFDTGSGIADLTSGDVEPVSSEALQQAISRASAAGTSLRVVVADPNGEFVPAEDIVNTYGGTAIAYQATRVGFEGASRDMSKAQLDRAINAAKVEQDIGQSANAFVQVIENEGLDRRSAGIPRNVLMWLLLPAAAFMFWGAYSYWTARNRRIKRQRKFAERKQVLTDWASQLGPEVEALRAPVVASPNGESQRVWHEAQEFVANILPTLDTAKSVGELDAAEMRIGRTAIKLRDLRRNLDL